MLKKRLSRVVLVAIMVAVFVISLSACDSSLEKNVTIELTQFYESVFIAKNLFDQTIEIALDSESQVDSAYVLLTTSGGETMIQPDTVLQRGKRVSFFVPRSSGAWVFSAKTTDQSGEAIFEIITESTSP